MRISKQVLICIAALNVIACGQSTTEKSSNNKMADQKPNFRLELTDAPNDNISAVFINIHHVELRVTKGDKSPWVRVAEGLGVVDLLTLQNGVTLPMDNVTLPADSSVTQIRLVLDSSGHYITYDGEKTCQLKTPSEQKTGVKLLIHKGIDIQPGYTYKVVADFDAKKSIVMQGNGGCLLKPVIKLKSASRVMDPEEPQEPVDEGQEPVEEPIPVEGDNSGDDATGGFEPPTPAEIESPVIGIEDLNHYMM